MYMVSRKNPMEDYFSKGRTLGIQATYMVNSCQGNVAVFFIIIIFY